MDKRQVSQERIGRGRYRKMVKGSGKGGMDEVIMRGRRGERE
jgi:hypothetical protein